MTDLERVARAIGDPDEWSTLGGNHKRARDFARARAALAAIERPCRRRQMMPADRFLMIVIGAGWLILMCLAVLVVVLK